MKLTDLAQRQASHVILYGDPKAGKSMLAASVLKAGFKLLWVSCDNGHEILFKPEFEAYRGNVDIIVLPDTREFPVAIDTCLKLVSGAQVKICDAHGQVNCSTCARLVASFSTYQLLGLPLDTIVVFDHISQIADSAMNFICNSLKGPFALEVAAGTYKPTWEDFRVQGTLMNKFLTNIQQSAYNVICIAHTVETEMEDGTKKLVPQVGTVPFSRNAGKYFDHMVYCEIMNKSHKFGSATTYKISALTGSRKDVKIEDQKEAASLAPFFNGEAAKAAAMVESKAASDTLVVARKEAATAELVETYVETVAEKLARLKTKR